MPSRSTSIPRRTRSSAAAEAVQPSLLERVRERLAGLPRVAECRMFGGTAFLVGGKMCVAVGPGPRRAERVIRLLCRIDPASQAAAVAREGCSTLTMNGRELRGYVLVAERAVAHDDELSRWIDLALDFNPRARATRARR